MNKRTVHLGLSILSAITAGIGVISALGEVRLVTIIIIFAGGFGAGAGLTAAITSYRKDG